MARRPGSIPSYRLHRPTGQAVVRLDGQVNRAAWPGGAPGLHWSWSAPGNSYAGPKSMSISG